jgi:hypothetical protein
MTLHAPVYTLGTRVRLRRGRLPMNPQLVGRTGIVVALDDYQPGKYGVVLDGEPGVRELAEDELDRVDG